jgi:hypothetical protein
MRLTSAAADMVPSIVATGRKISLGFSERKFLKVCGSFPILRPTLNINAHKA